MAKKRPYRVYLDCFTSLDDLPRSKEGDAKAVLQAIMGSRGQFSIFDATRTQRLAQTMDFIERKSGWVFRPVKQPSYPWVQIELTDKGKKELA